MSSPILAQHNVMNDAATAATRRFCIALTLSLVLHGSLLMPSIWPEKPQNSSLAMKPQLRATLTHSPASEPLLKNTLALETPTPPEAKPVTAISNKQTHAATKPKPTNSKSAQQHIRAAQRKLSEHQFYPPAAIALGLEGEVRLLLSLSTEGAILDINIASSSGHPLLDQAALQAVQKMQHIPDTGLREMLLPVIFRLQ